MQIFCGINCTHYNHSIELNFYVMQTEYVMDNSVKMKTCFVFHKSISVYY